MIERHLYAALEAGIEQFTKRPELFDALFKEDYDLPTEEVEAIKTLWATKPPDVIHNYPRTDSSFPLYSVILGDEGEKEVYLNNDAYQIDDEGDPQFGADVKSSIWDHSYQIWVCTEHPDMTVYYYEVAKSILLVGDWGDLGLWEINVRGRDLAPDPRYMPEFIFIRQLTFSCNREFQRLLVESRFQKAWQVGGIHVDKNAEPGDVGDVKTLVTPYVLGG